MRKRKTVTHLLLGKGEDVACQQKHPPPALGTTDKTQFNCCSCQRALVRKGV